MILEVQQSTSQTNGARMNQLRKPASSKLRPSGSGYCSKTAIQRHDMVERVILAVHDNIQEALPLQTLAEMAAMSPYHFNRVFRQVTGIPPCQFVGALRLDLAKRLLLTTKLSVTDVCFEVGYNSLGTFTTHFRHLVGLPPSSLRRLADSSVIPYPISLPYLTIDKGQEHQTRNLLAVRVTTPEPFEGLLFVGLFPTPIPQGRPNGCLIANGSGIYQIAPVADGRYYVLAIAFAQVNNPLMYLLPDRSNLWVGVGLNPVYIHQGICTGCTDVVLRPPELTDPPILAALSFLFVEQIAADADEPEAVFEGLSRSVGEPMIR